MLDESVAGIYLNVLRNTISHTLARSTWYEFATYLPNIMVFTVRKLSRTIRGNTFIHEVYFWFLLFVLPRYVRDAMFLYLVDTQNEKWKYKIFQVQKMHRVFGSPFDSNDLNFSTLRIRTFILLSSMFNSVPLSELFKFLLNRRDQRYRRIVRWKFAVR
jgi:hypothetical protein